jgi:endonuclease/exonuclease/phosphatase family metal-dependent hydrolase
MEPKNSIHSNNAGIRAMTFNVRGSFHRQDGLNVWQNRRKLNQLTIEKCKPDIIGFQEVQKGNFDAYSHFEKEFDHMKGHACKRTMHWSFDEAKDRWQGSKSVSESVWSVYDYVTKNLGTSSQHDEYCPIYWRRKRFECVDSGCFYLSETPDVESIGWESKLIRTVTWVRLKEQLTGANLLVANTHFPHERHDPTRTECARVILQKLEQINTENFPVIMMGDFNCHASIQTGAYALFLENGYQDTYFDDGTIFLNTFHHFLGDNCPWHLGRIDWILIKSSAGNIGSAQLEAASSAEVIRYAQPPLYPSDHYPMTADLLLTTNQVIEALKCI